MKRILSFLLLLVCITGHLYAQEQKSAVSIREISVEEQVRLGFMFVNAVLALLFLLLFSFYPQQRLNLFFGLFNLCLFLSALNSAYDTVVPIDQRRQIGADQADACGLCIGVVDLHAADIDFARRRALA